MEKYNINDEEYKQYLEGLLIANLPIEFYGLTIKSFSVKEILIMGENRLNEIMKPFLVDITLMDESLVKNGFKNLDVVAMLGDSYINNLKTCISLIFDLSIEKISLLPNVRTELVIDTNNGFLFINADRFDELRNILMHVFKIKKVTKKELLELNNQMKFQDNKYSERFAKLFKGRAKEKTKQKAITVGQMYNLVVHSQENIDYQNVLNWSLYQLYNTYKSLGIKESHSFNMRFYSSGMASFKAEDIKTLYQQLS